MNATKDKYQKNMKNRHTETKNIDMSNKYAKNKYMETKNRNIKNKYTETRNIDINNKYTENKRKKKKIRKVLKRILTIILFVIVVLSTLFIIRMNENGWTYGGLLATILGHNSKTAENLETIYIVVTGESQNLTDSIMICAYNPKSNNASVMSIPRDTFTGSDQKKATASDKINTLYHKNPDKLLAEVNEITGLNIKYYMNIDTKGLKDLIDSIGGVYFEVPIDMNYDDSTQDLHIHLSAGYQLLDGDKAEQVLRFRHNNDGTSYPSSYGDNDIGRMRTQREFIKTLVQQLANQKSLNSVKQYIQIAKENVTTNFNLDDIIDYVPYAIEFNTENLQTMTLPGEPKKCNGVWLYIPNEAKVNETINESFKSLGNNTNIDQKKSTNVVEFSNEEINIELLNGTSDKEKLKEAQKALEESGYNVTKTGVTNAVSKTSIINRADESTGAGEKIKNVLGVGTITSGESSGNIDFSIIIGKDY